MQGWILQSSMLMKRIGAQDSRFGDISIVTCDFPTEGSSCFRCGHPAAPPASLSYRNREV